MEYKYFLIDDATGEVIKQSNDLTELKEGRDPFKTTLSQKCDICGKYEDITDIVEYDGTAYCNDCCCECLAYCEHCGEWHDVDNCYEVRTGWRTSETWCESCAYNDATQCYECGDWFADSNYDLISCHGNFYCENCSDYIYYCPRCEAYYFDDEGSYNVDEDRWFCNACYNELFGDRSTLITGYHHRPTTIYYTDNGSTENGENFKGFGIELEVDTDTHLHECEAADHLNNTLGKHVYFNDDGSLNKGFEIITQPHTRNALMSLDWTPALTKLVELGYRSHDTSTCGLHMHVSRLMFGENETERTINIAKIIQFYNLFWNDILRFSRRTEAKADRWAKRYLCANSKELAEDLAKKSTSELNEMFYYTGARYHAVNLTNEHTIEFRLMRGTLNPTTFKATLDFLMTVAENAKNVTNVTSLKQWLKGIAPETKEYMKKRKCFGYSNNQTTENEQGDEE